MMNSIWLPRTISDFQLRLQKNEICFMEHRYWPCSKSAQSGFAHHIHIEFLDVIMTQMESIGKFYRGCVFKFTKLSWCKSFAVRVLPSFDRALCFKNSLCAFSSPFLYWNCCGCTTIVYHLCIIISIVCICVCVSCSSCCFVVYYLWVSHWIAAQLCVYCSRMLWQEETGHFFCCSLQVYSYWRLVECIVVCAHIFASFTALEKNKGVLNLAGPDCSH